MSAHTWLCRLIPNQPVERYVSRYELQCPRCHRYQHIAGKDEHGLLYRAGRQPRAAVVPMRRV